MRAISLRALLCLSAVAVFAACRPGSDPAPEPAAAPTEGSGAEAAPAADGSAQPAVVDEGKPDEQPNPRERPRRTLDDTLASMDDAAWLGRIPTVDSSWDADEIVGLLRRNDGSALVLTAEREGRQTTFNTWTLQRDVAAPAAEPHSAFVIRSPDVAQARVMSVPGLGFGLIKAADNVADDAAPATTLFWRTVGIDGATLSEPVALRVSPWNVRREYSAAVIGDRVAVCFEGWQGRVAGDGPLAIACGAIDFDGEWVTPLAEVVPASAGARAMMIGTGDATEAMLLTFEGDRLWGRLLTFEMLVTVHERADLSGEPIATGAEYEHRRPPQVMTVDGMTAWALPGFEEHHPRAGMLDAEGRLLGGKRQIPELGTYASRPVMMSTAVGPTMMYGEYGLDGERTAVVFGEPRPNPVETVTPLGILPPASQARQGVAADGLVALVFDIDDEDAAITVLFEQSLIGSLRGVPQNDTPVPAQ